MQKNKENPLKSYQSNSLGIIYYIIDYESCAFKTADRQSKDTRDLVNFKHGRGKNGDKIALALNLAIKEISPNADIAVIPSHLPNIKNNLQDVMNYAGIKTIAETPQRKLNHRKEIPPEQIDCYEITHTKKSNELIIIDDVITSGMTMQFWKNAMARFGYDKIHLLTYALNKNFSKYDHPPKKDDPAPEIDKSLQNAKWYNSEELYQLAITACQDVNCTFIDDIISVLPCTKSTFYKYIPLGSHQLNHIKELLIANRVAIKKKLRKQWGFIDASAALQVALYKLIANDDELARLVNTEPPKEHSAPAIVEIYMRPARLAESDEN